jgi:hypothetical protein
MRGTKKIGKSREHRGVAIYWYKKDPTPGAETSQRPLPTLLRLTEFILPPPYPSVKELPPQGGNSYDQNGVFSFKSFIHGKTKLILGPFFKLGSFVRTRSRPASGCRRRLGRVDVCVQMRRDVRAHACCPRHNEPCRLCVLLACPCML